MSKDWDDKLMVHDWPEMGPGELSLEELYQMFKKRLLDELPITGSSDGSAGDRAMYGS